MVYLNASNDSGLCRYLVFNRTGFLSQYLQGCGNEIILEPVESGLCDIKKHGEQNKTIS